MVDQLRALQQRWLTGELTKAEYIEQMYGEHERLFWLQERLSDGRLQEIRIGATEIEAVTRDGVRFRVPPGDVRDPVLEVLNFGEYEEFERRLLVALGRESPVIFDVGANVGWHSLLLSRQVPDSMVYAFEPVPSTYERLCDSIARNSATNVRALSFGLGEEEASVEFALSRMGSVASSMRDITGEASGRFVRGRIRKMDDVCPNDIPDPNLVKCDVEGAELLVFRGAQSTIRRSRPVVMAEMLRKWAKVFEYHPNELVGLFRCEGYECYAIRREGLRQIDSVTEDEVATNFLFADPRRHAQELAVALAVSA